MYSFIIYLILIGVGLHYLRKQEDLYLDGEPFKIWTNYLWIALAFQVSGVFFVIGLFGGF